MSNVRKIFKPDAMFNDFIKTCWCDNIRVIEWTNYFDVKEGKIPVHKELKANGVYALSIEPQRQKDYFVVVLPINKTWDSEDFTKWAEPVLTFDIIGCTSFKMSVQIIDDKDAVVQKNEISVAESEQWTPITMHINKINNARMLNIYGSILSLNFLIKDIVISDIC